MPQFISAYLDLQARYKLDRLFGTLDTVILILSCSELYILIASFYVFPSIFDFLLGSKFL